jgi:hypothetical protein
MSESKKLLRNPSIKDFETESVPCDYQEEMLYVWRQKLLSKIGIV